EVDEAARIISATADADASVTFGAVIKDGMTDQVRITVIATGFDEGRSRIGQLVRPQNPPIQGVVSDPANQNKNPNPQTLESTPEEKETDGNEKKKDEYGEEDFDIPAFLRKIH
ncbi:MAG TPA: hypothetical protein VLE44_02230, partial [Candidatus Saccharimonadales bacterium]|nr:hypothetical protein [Candidatus Saccharimonadales bacterium]